MVGTRRTLRKNVIGLGLSKINSSVEITDNSANRGMINKVSFLLKIEG
ncbi:MAG: 50S ribosomal protein L30 [Nitrosomonas sp.]